MISNENYEYVLLTDKQRQQIIDTFHPGSRFAFSCDNLNLVYGIQSRTSGFVMTLVYYLSDSIKRCDEADDYEFILLFAEHAQLITCKQERGKDELTLCSKLFGSLREDVLGALWFYEHSSRFEYLDTVFGEEHSYSKYAEQNREYIETLVLEPERKQNAGEMSGTPGKTGVSGETEMSEASEKHGISGKMTMKSAISKWISRPVAIGILVGILMICAGLYLKMKQYIALSVISGGDGPTSVFIAGKISETSGDLQIITGVGLLFVMAVITAISVKKKKKEDEAK